MYIFYEVNILLYDVIVDIFGEIFVLNMVSNSTSSGNLRMYTLDGDTSIPRKITAPLHPHQYRKSSPVAQRSQRVKTLVLKRRQH